MLELDARRPHDVCHEFVAQTVIGITESLIATIGEAATGTATLWFQQHSRSAAPVW
jgi:hypothetical protein